MSKTVIEMVVQCGFWREHIDTWLCSTKDFERFAELVRADEREACEMAIEELPPDADRGDCAAAIRARGNT